MFACWMVGAAFCVLPSFAGRSSTERSRIRIDEVFLVLQPKLLLTGHRAKVPEGMQGALTTVELPPLDPTAEAPPDHEALILDLAPNDMALIQFTSGSTGGAKGAVVRFGQLQANLDAIATRIQTHRVGSDGVLGTALSGHGADGRVLAIEPRADLGLMGTDRFVRRPAS